MFVKRDDGLDKVLLPFDIGALVLAVLLTARCGVSGILAVPVFAGWWLCAFAGLLLAFVLVIWLISLTVDMKKPTPQKDHPFHRAIVVYVIGMLCRLGRVRIHCAGSEKLPAGRFLIVSNHLSGYDPIVTVWALRKRTLSVIMKPEILRIPIAGPMIYWSCYMPINREEPREAMKTINTAASLLRGDVTSIGIYPEGTRNRTPEAGLQPFHNGVFKIAQKGEVPLVVAAVSGTEKIMKSTPWRRTEVYLTICEVIPAEELKGSTAAVSQRAREIIEGELAGGNTA